jgi:hypothetical protein
MVGGSSGTIQLEIVTTDPTTLQVTSDIQVNVTYGCSATTFLNALNNFNNLQPYVLSVVRNIYDSNGNNLTTTTGAARIDYVTSIYLLRPASAISQNFKLTYYGYTGTLTTTFTQTHSPLITGTFILTMGGINITVSGSANIPYNVAANTLQNSISSQIQGFQYVDVYLASQYGCGYSCTWII